MAGVFKIPKDWYRDPKGFFNHNYIRIFKDLTPKELSARQVDFVENVCQLRPPMEVLDLACGFGRHAIEFARRGYVVSGQDINEPFLDVARKSAVQEGLSINYINRDMRDLPYENKFDAVCIFYQSFGYLETDEDHQKVIDEIAKALKQGGKVFLDILSPDIVLRYWSGRRWWSLSDGGKVLLDYNFDPKTRRVDLVQTRFFRDGFQETVGYNQRVFAVDEISGMFSKAGIELMSAYGSYDGDSYSQNSRYCLVLGRRNIS